MGVMDALARYAYHPDRATGMANTVALLVASNGPFYPLYVWWLVPEAGLASCATMLSTPLFLAIPWLSRRCGWLARAALPLLGLTNTLWTIALLGSSAGLAVFVYPCIALALLCWRERVVMLLVLGGALAAQQLALRRPWPPLSGLDPAAQMELSTMNAASVGALLGFLVLMGARQWRLVADRDTPP